mmetsp:Transcript_2127/g.4320  ORF Transcript_2127/g.4320 Transcript_2127/m.4320 type:complete len:242 (-) Transcript_2127:31-756(-)
MDLADDTQALEREREQHNRLLARGCVGEEVTELGVGEGVDLRVWAANGKVAPHAWQRLEVCLLDLANGWLPAVRRVLRSDAHSNHMAFRARERVDRRRVSDVDDVGHDGLRGSLGSPIDLGQVDAHRDHQLKRWNVLASDSLRHWVLHLQAWVELEEIELLCLRQEEVLDGAGVGVVDHQGEACCSKLHLTHRLWRDGNWGPLLDDLLEPALHRAVAPGEDGDVLVLVGHNLDLDVARLAT